MLNSDHTQLMSLYRRGCEHFSGIGTRQARGRMIRAFLLTLRQEYELNFIGVLVLLKDKLPLICEE